ncbi:MAG: hypothetical protein K2J78_04610 [Muribaculaceae bacterium]|nr:hypothetical protein [Muribaculaceae bacterium]
MKNPTIFSFILVLVLTAIFPSDSTANNDSDIRSILLQRVDDHIEYTPAGMRSPTRPIYCTITQQEGIDIPSVDKSEIMLYEIYDEEDNNIFTSVEEETFIDYIFTTTGTVRILLHLPEYNLVGYLTL